MIQLNIFFFKDCESISYDLSLKKTFATFMFNNIMILFVSVCYIVCICSVKSFKMIFVNLFNWIFISVMNNQSWCFTKYNNFFWLLIQKFCSSCLIKQSNVMFSQYHNCFYQIYTESLCCFFDIFWNNTFD